MLSLNIQRLLNLTRNPVIVELGACDGSETVAMFMCCYVGKPRIVSFEPDPRNAERCRSRQPASVEFHTAAVGNVTGKAPFHLASPDVNGAIGSSSLSEFKDLTESFPWCKQMGTVDVDCWRLDDFCETHQVPYIDLLFADVQGAELLVVEGAQRILKSTRYLWTEFEGRYAGNAGTLYKDSCSLEEIKSALPGDWTILETWGGDALLVNNVCTGNPNQPISFGLHYSI